jgi:hypothetical protein
MLIVKPEELLKLKAEAEKIVTHETPVGAVSFVALTKSFVEAHYRHGKDGQLIFVHGYTNKKLAKPEDLTVNALQKQGEAIHKKAKPPLDPNHKFNSFHFGDEVFVKYSHMHDQHFLSGAVVGIRKDSHHGGLLVAVRLLNGYLEYYAPTSLVHISKQDYESRKHEISHHQDDKGKTIDYIHLSDEQKVKFYDLYKAWFVLQRMGEVWAFEKNKDQFITQKKVNTSNDATIEFVPKNKSQLSAEQKILLEKLNPFPVVPYEGLLQAVAQPGYTDGQHHAAVKKILDDIEQFKAKGAPTIEFPKLKKQKSKKENHFVPPAWLKGMFPSVEMEDKQTKEEAMEDLGKLSMEYFGTKANPTTEGSSYGNYKDIYHGQPITHGAVIEAKPEGTVYEKPAPVPAPKDEKEIVAQFWQTIESAETEAKKAPSAKSKFPTPTVKTDKAPTPKAASVSTPSPATSPKLIVPSSTPGDISDLQFKVVGNANKAGFQGAHSKYILHDKDGNQYLFKPNMDEAQHVTWAEIIGNKMAKIVGLPCVEMGSKPVTIKVPMGMQGSYQGVNATGSVQKIVGNLKHNTIQHYVDNGFSNCPKELVEDLQREHVLDWLLGNNDAWAGQFIIDQNGDLIGVDKGQSFKFYGDDILSLKWDPNGNSKMGHEQIYNLLLKSAKKGNVKLDFGVVHKFIQENIGNLTSMALHHMVKPYEAHSAVWGNKPNELGNIATKRRANLLKDFKKLYESVGIATEYDADKKKYISTPAPAKEKLPESDTYQPDAYKQIDTQFHQAVTNAGVHGKSIMVGGGDVEDMNLMFTHYEWDPAHKPQDFSGKGLEVSFKVLAGSDSKLSKYFDTIEDQQITYHNQNGTLPIGHDPLSSIIISAGKTVNHHAPNGGSKPDGAYNETKIEPFATWFQDSEKLDPKKPIISPEKIAMKLVNKFITEAHYEDPFSLAHQLAKHYHAQAEELLEAVKNKNKITTPEGKTKHFVAWQGPYKSKKTSVSTKKHPWATYPIYTTNPEGKLVRQKGSKHAWHQGYEGDVGCMFTKHLDGNIDIHYYPHYSQDLHGQNNLRSQQGTCVIDFQDWDGDVQAMHKARQLLKDMGLDHRLSTHDDIEALYLTRIAWHNKANVKYPSEWKKLMGMENNKEKIEALQDFCAKSYGGKKPKELKNYHPLPMWDNDSGSHYFLNPYILDYLDGKPSNIMLPKHQLTSSTDDEALTNIVQHGIICTELRRKYGWPIYGKSVMADQQSGGASYVFCSATNTSADNMMSGVGSGVLVFRPELLARTDCFGSYGDNFGSTNTVPLHGHSSIDSRASIMDIVSKNTPLYEVTFKNRIPLDKWFLGIKGGSYAKGWAKKMKTLIKKLKPHILNHASFDEE